MSTPQTPRPVDREPLTGVGRKVALILGSAVGFATLLLQLGVLTVEQAAAINATFTAADLALPGVLSMVAAGGTALSAFSVSRIARGSVTPMSDPRDDLGRRLIPATGDDPVASSTSATTPPGGDVDTVPGPPTDSGRPRRGRPDPTRIEVTGRGRHTGERPERVLSADQAAAFDHGGVLSGLYGDTGNVNTTAYDTGSGSTPDTGSSNSTSEPSSTPSDSSSSSGPDPTT